MTRVAINGFGRMGRLVTRVIEDEFPELDIVLINEMHGDFETCAYLLEFDSAHGRWRRNSVIETPNGIQIGDKTIPVTFHEHIADIPLMNHKIDIVIECTGAFKSRKTLDPYFQAGVKKVIVSAPVKEDVLNVVVGINDNLYNSELDHIVTAASCTTNCLAPVVKVLKESFGIKHGMITTLHNITNTQCAIDATWAAGKEMRRSRSLLMNMIPTTTGSAKAITMIYPELSGKLNGHAIRVPLANASLTDCVFELEQEVTREDVNSAFEIASKKGGELEGILGYETKPLVSCDYTNDPRSCIVDAGSTMVVDGTQLKVYAWYDNEWGYVNRMAELTQLVASKL